MRPVALAILRLYKRWVSPSLLPSCRYVPTCSEYAMEAIDRYGFFFGAWKAALRLLRCHPFVKGGYDPVVKNPARERRVHAVPQKKAEMQTSAEITRTNVPLRELIMKSY